MIFPDLPIISEQIAAIIGRLMSISKLVKEKEQ
jgi:hypothetical protein